MIRKLIKPNFKEIKQKSNQENRRKPPPPYKTHAENYYYIKQMNNRTQLVLELANGETLKGVLDWYDEKCLKVKKLDGGTLIVFKSQIKFIYKNPDFAEPKREEPVPGK
jgi:sRNA-binding regulator protein Hfq